MSDLVKRLRFRVEFVNGGNGNVLELPDDLCVEAANYIERLEEHLNTARADAFEEAALAMLDWPITGKAAAMKIRALASD